LESLEPRELLSTLVLPNTSVTDIVATFNKAEPDGSIEQFDAGISGGNFLGTLDGTPLTASYCVSINLGISAPRTFDNASATSDGTIYGTAVPNAGAIGWLLANFGPTATTDVQQGALQAAIWRVEYGNGFQVDGVDNNNPIFPDDYNSAIAATYQADLAALGNNTLPVNDLLWISPDATSQSQGLVALAATPTPTPTPSPTPTPPTPMEYCDTNPVETKSRLRRHHKATQLFRQSSLPGDLHTADTPPLNQAILNFARRKFGAKVEKGTCYDLAAAAYQAAGARLDPPGGMNEDYVWGQAVGTFTPGQFSDSGNLIPGDVFQFRDAHLSYDYKASHFTANYAHHTAIVNSVNGTVVEILEQHTSQGKSGRRLFVTKRVIDLSGLDQGTVRAYRPEPATP
jgi:hypothetical protein